MEVSKLGRQEAAKRMQTSKGFDAVKVTPISK